MITVHVKGGLGNQMFQYTLAKALAKKHNTTFKLDTYAFEKYKLHKYCLEVFEIEKNYADKKDIPGYMYLSSENRYINCIMQKFKNISKKISPKFFLEKQFNYDPDVFSTHATYFEGYFQSEKYFKDIENDIRKDFTFAIAPSSKNSETAEKISSCNAVSLHVRRGDYVNNKNTQAFHGSCSLDYYKEAIDIIREKVENPIFFFFSDDIDWVKKELSVTEESYYIDWNDADTNYEDLRLMSLCKHNIIANSSFSWWGAWLNNNKEKIVIAPSRWFNSDSINYSDVIPESWMKI